MSWAPPLRPPAEGVVAREAGVTHGPGSPRRTLGQVRPGTRSLPGRSTRLCSQPPGCSTVALTEQRLRPHRKGSGGLIFIEARQSQRLWLGWVLSASRDPPAVCTRKAGMLGSRERLPPPACRSAGRSTRMSVDNRRRYLQDRVSLEFRYLGIILNQSLQKYFI